ncbi:hypothetical protein [Aurantimonas sp. VKM B-3413]|uniref:hypothetical protein n=1 Tax=Aurantimonas sp. VKM B-3413 TaxID=2779401 RepID=UPI001E5366F9|nr:hypothetical protein [Aurantimonas sp. VKM B-3413]
MREGPECLRDDRLRRQIVLRQEVESGGDNEGRGQPEKRRGQSDGVTISAAPVKDFVRDAKNQRRKNDADDGMFDDIPDDGAAKKGKDFVEIDHCEVSTLNGFRLIGRTVSICSSRPADILAKTEASSTLSVIFPE